MGLIGGLLATLMWYGGYHVLFVGLPAAALVFFAVPNYWAPAVDRTVEKQRTKTNPKIFYYCGIAFLYMMIYNACGANLSTHIRNIGDPATAGIGVAFLMGGGAVSGIFFDKLSKKLGDYAISLALIIVTIGYVMLSFSQHSLPMVFVSVFLVGTSLSIVMPHSIFMVSTLATDKSKAQTATALVSTVCPAIGVFLSPIIITGITTSLYGELETAARYLFVSAVVLVFAIAVAIVTFLSKRKQTAAA